MANFFRSVKFVDFPKRYNGEFQNFGNKILKNYLKFWKKIRNITFMRAIKKRFLEKFRIIWKRIGIDFSYFRSHTVPWKQQIFNFTKFSKSKTVLSILALLLPCRLMRVSHVDAKRKNEQLSFFSKGKKRKEKINSWLYPWQPTTKSWDISVQ